MKSIQIADATLLSSLKRVQRQIIGAGILTNKAFILMIAAIASIPAYAGTLSITYSNTGGLTGPPVLNGTILTLDALAYGSILSSNPALNAAWNPATFHTHDFLDVTTGLDNGTFTITFASGETLFGNLFEADSTALLTTNIGPFTQILTFTGGTGSFAGASGSASGGGDVEPTGGFTTSGSGTLTAAAISTPEPATVALIFGGLLIVAGSRKLVRAITSSQT